MDVPCIGKAHACPHRAIAAHAATTVPARPLARDATQRYCVVPPGAGVAGATGAAGSLAGGVPGAVEGAPGIVGAGEGGDVRSRAGSLALGGGMSVGPRSQADSMNTLVMVATTPSTTRGES